MIGRLSTQFSTVITKLTPQERYWLHAKIYSGVGNPDTVAQFMQLFLRGFRPNDVLHFQWAITSAAICDVDAFTGGAAIVDSVSIKTITTAEWIQQHMEPKPKKKGAKSA